jgi:hypothetical protein
MAFAIGINDGVAGDLKKPTHQTGCIAHLAAALMHRQEDGLQDIFRRHRIGHMGANKLMETIVEGLPEGFGGDR